MKDSRWLYLFLDLGHPKIKLMHILIDEQKQLMEDGVDTIGALVSQTFCLYAIILYR